MKIELKWCEDEVEMKQKSVPIKRGGETKHSIYDLENEPKANLVSKIFHELMYLRETPRIPRFTKTAFQ